MVLSYYARFLVFVQEFMISASAFGQKNCRGQKNRGSGKYVFIVFYSTTISCITSSFSSTRGSLITDDCSICLVVGSAGGSAAGVGVGAGAGVGAGVGAGAGC